MHQPAADALRQLGGDPTNFVARQLNLRIASDADFILTMTPTHRNTVLEMAPRQLRKTFTLGEAALLATEFTPRTVADLAALRTHLPDFQPVEVSDPIGKDAATFEAVSRQIASLLPPVLALCRETAAQSAD